MGQTAATLNAARWTPLASFAPSGNGDHVLEDDVFGQEIEEVSAVDEAGQAFLDDAEEGVQRGVVAEFVVGRRHLAASKVYLMAAMVSFEIKQKARP